MRLYFISLWLIQVPYSPGKAWVVTSYVETVALTTFEPSTFIWTTQPASTEVGTINVAPPSPIPSVLTTLTTVNGVLTQIDIVLPSGAGVEINPTFGAATTLPTIYYVPVTYKPAKVCSATWIYITTIEIEVPEEVQTLLTPWSVATRTQTHTYDGAAITQTNIDTNVVAILNPTDVPDDVYSSASSESAPPEIISSCTSPSDTETQTATITYPSDPHKTIAVASSTPTVDTSVTGEHGTTCGKKNPSCKDCELTTEICIGNGCPPEPRTYYQCEDGQYNVSGSPPRYNLRAISIGVAVGWVMLWLLA